MSTYLETVYNEQVRPRTSYPQQLARYMFHRFGFQKNQVFLDVGCGRAEFAHEFSQLGLDVYGLDLEPNIAINSDDVNVSYANVISDTYPINSNSVDIVFSKSMLEHMYDPKHFMSEQFRVLRPGGIIILLTPDWMTQSYIFYNDFTHCRPYTLTSMKNLLLVSGFQNVKSELFYQLPLLWKHPSLKVFSRALQLFGPVKKLHKNKFHRWSRELMIIGFAQKPL